MGIYAGRSGRRWRRLVARMRALRLPCWICYEPIDYSLPYNHRRSFTVDHAIPIAVAPALAEEWSNLRPAHRCCNSSKGTRPKVKRVMPTPRTSRAW